MDFARRSSGGSRGGGWGGLLKIVQRKNSGGAILLSPLDKAPTARRRYAAPTGSPVESRGKLPTFGTFAPMGPASPRPALPEELLSSIAGGRHEGARLSRTGGQGVETSPILGSWPTAIRSFASIP